MSLYRIPLLLTTAGCLHRCLTPPMPTVKRSKMMEQDGLLERMFMFDGSGTTILITEKIIIWTVTLAESAIIIAQAGFISDRWKKRILVCLTGSATRNARTTTTLSASLVTGTLLALAGTFFRVAAYRGLDRSFTYQLTIRDDHRLVTSFPYNIVRHPSYAGGAIALVGLGLTLLTSDGWTRGVIFAAAGNREWSIAKRALVITWITVTPLIFVPNTMVMFPRTYTEDKMLKAKFGKEWDVWAEKVPHKLIPGLW